MILEQFYHDESFSRTELRYKLLNEYKLNEHTSHNHNFIYFFFSLILNSHSTIWVLFHTHFCSLDIKHQPKTQSYLIKGHLIRNVVVFNCCVNNLFDLSALLIYFITYRYNGGISYVVHQVRDLFHQLKIKFSGIAHVLYVYYIYWTCVLQRSTNLMIAAEVNLSKTIFTQHFFFKAVLKQCSVISSFYYSYIDDWKQKREV